MTANALLDLLAPPACLACGGPGRDLCGGCRRSLVHLAAEECCTRCGLPAPCGRRCPAAGAAFDGAWAPVAHAGPARELVAALKFRRARAAADVMAAGMARAPFLDAAGGAVLVPVPTHRSRTRARGFDQAFVLAAALGRRTGLPVARSLARGGPATRQLGAGRRERRDPERLSLTCRGTAPRLAVLVDDVHTTGATLDAAARAMRAAGAAEVRALTFSRALG